MQRLTQRRAGGPPVDPPVQALAVACEAQARFLKRQLSLPVSTMSQ